MSNLLKSKFLLGVMVVAVMFVGVVAVATTASADCTVVPTVRAGSTGTSVQCVQTKVGVTADGSFGPMTAAAVMAFQSAHGLTADGVVGPMTAAALNGTVASGGSYPAGCTSTSGYSTTTGVKCDSGSSSLPAGCTSTSGYSSTTGMSCSGGSSYPAGCTSTSGYSTTTGKKCDSSESSSTVVGSGDGDITGINEVSTGDSNVEEGTTGEVFGFEFDVEGDVEVNRVDVYLDSTLAGNESENAEDYFSSAILMIDGDEVAELDVEDWDEDSYAIVGSVTGDSDEYRLRFSGLSEVFQDGDNPEVTVALVANNSIDSDDQSETWGIEITTDSIRFLDGNGFSSEEGEDITETFGIDAEDTAELNVKSSSNDPDASTLEVSSTDTTEEVEVFVFEIEEENGVDATINDLTVTITTGATTGTTDESAVVTDAYLYNGSTLLGSESVPDTGIIAFEDLGLDIAGNDTEELTLKLTFADADDFTAGTDISATISGSSDIDDAEDANGNDEGDMTLGGSATSETHALRTEGIIVVFDSSSYLKTSSDTTGINETVQFTLEFDVTAFGDDMYIDETCGFDDDGNYLTSQISISLDGDDDGSSTTCTNFDSSGDDAGSGFEVLEGQTEHFTVTVLGNGGEGAGAGNATTFKARINNIGYNVGADGAGDTSYAFEMSDYKSAAVTVYDR